MNCLICIGPGGKSFQKNEGLDMVIFICMWMSCQPMVVLQRQHFPEWLGYAHVHSVYEVLLVSDKMKCP